MGADIQEAIGLAGIPDGHAHRFRDTFAVELLLAGVSLGLPINANDFERVEDEFNAPDLSLYLEGEGPLKLPAEFSKI